MCISQHDPDRPTAFAVHYVLLKSLLGSVFISNTSLLRDLV